MEGRLPYDVLLDATDPDLVKLEMDLFWISRGGQDPLALAGLREGDHHRLGTHQWPAPGNT